MGTRHLLYVGPHADGVEIFDTGEWASPGEPIEVDAELAGRAPKGEPGDEDFDPGEGLLAQPSNWKLATAAATTKAKKQAEADQVAGEEHA